MANYTAEPRPRTWQTYWYLTNGEVLREPDLLSTPAGRRTEIDGFGESFWTTELEHRLDLWAEEQAKDRDAQVLAKARNRDDHDGEDWLPSAIHEDFLSQMGGLNNQDPTFEYGTNRAHHFYFYEGTRAYAFVATLHVRTSYYRPNEYWMTTKCHKMVPAQRNKSTDDDGGAYAFPYSTNSTVLSYDEIAQLLGEPWGFEKEEDEKGDYVPTAAKFAKACMQISEFASVDGVPFKESDWDPEYVRNLQHALTNEGPINRLKDHLDGIKSALEEMGLSMDEFEKSEIYRIVNNDPQPLLVEIVDSKESPKSVLYFDLPHGRIFTQPVRSIDQNSLTLLEMARRRAGGNGEAEELSTALSIMAGNNALERQAKTAEAFETAARILPTLKQDN